MPAQVTVPDVAETTGSGDRTTFAIAVMGGSK
jgi:hypothetical protein